MNHVERAIRSMSKRRRQITAEVLATSDQPILQALALDLVAIVAHEDADFAELEHAFRVQHIAEMAEIEKLLPPAGLGRPEIGNEDDAS